jgi:hypothetical protein
MAKRIPNPRLAKIHRSYTVPDIVARFGVHPNTVRAWIRDGLAIIDCRRPLVVRGVELRDFLQARRLKTKRPCVSGEIYCLRCRAPKTPATNVVDYKPLSATAGQLVGICPTCEHFIYRCVSLAKLSQVRGNLEVLMPRAP